MPRTRPAGRGTRAHQPAIEGNPAEVPAPDANAAEASAPPEASVPAESLAEASGVMDGVSDTPPRPVAGRLRHVGGSVAGGISRNRGVLISAAAAALVLVAALALGPVDASNAILLGLGFDAGRCQLITALIFGGTTAVVAYLAGGVRWSAVVLGFIATTVIFGPTFVAETRTGMASTGIFVFDPMGWTITLLAFLVMSVLTAWACTACAMPVRRELAATARATVAASRQRPFNRRMWHRPVAALLVMGLLALTLPVAGDLFNLGVQCRMNPGDPHCQGLAPQDQPSTDVGAAANLTSPTAAESASDSPGASASATSTPTPTPTASPTQKQAPWKTSPPSGQGRMEYLGFPGPWTGAGTATVEVAVYLPPGYDKSGSKRYPAVYEAPFTFNLWNGGIHTKTILDTLINEGQIPPSLYVFMNAAGGPYPDTQCADSYDGREKFDRYLGVTVPTYIDKHYRTIAKAAARAVMGMSEGGYCAAILSLHHPDVFGSEISFSGYFTAGLGSASAKIPFGNNPPLINKDSPSYVAPRLDPGVRAGLYVVLVAQSSQLFYGSQAEEYARTLAAADIKYSYIEAEQPHGWPQVRDTVGQALVLVGLRQAELGVFD